jgi:AcrR family transcriptional regulator
MAKKNTKETILFAALKLFSDYGYDGVGVRDIARDVGIRESAIYKHYSSKHEIFSSILLRMNDVYGEKMAAYQQSWQIAQAENSGSIQENLVKMCISIFQVDLKDEIGSQLRRMLTFEQIKNTEEGKAFRDKLINDGIDYFTAVFAELIKQNYYRDADPYVMAIQFYSPFYLLLAKYDRQTDKYDEAIDLLQRHIKHFDFLHRKGRENIGTK